MLIKDFKNFIEDTFTKEKLNIVKGKEEYGFTNLGSEEILKIGYCTNLTIETAYEAARNGVNLLVTHHDAWEWMTGMKEEVLSILRQNNITHFYIHLPLDDAEFGNNTSILKKLGFSVVDKFSNEEGMYCGRIGEIDNPISMEELVDRIEVLLEEPIRFWKNNDKLIKRIGVVTGAGFSATDIKDAAELGCDVYFTGEKILYTVQYAKFIKINLIVGSHTFTEIFGLDSLFKMIIENYPTLEIVRIQEEHIEQGIRGIRAFDKSLYTLGVFDNNKLIGFIRCIGDGEHILVVQDLIVAPEYQKRGIGTYLFKTMLQKHSMVRMFIVITDIGDIVDNKFYQSFNLKKIEDMNMIAYIR